MILSRFVWWGVLLLFAAPTQAALIFNTNATWKYFKGRSEASSPNTAAWRNIVFDDSAWAQGPATFYYGEPFTGTLLSDMSGGYGCLFLRRSFVVTNLAQITALILKATVDDGFIIWINGTEVARFNVPSGNPANTTFASSAIEPTVNQYTLTNPSFVVEGENVVAVQAFNASLSGSSDFVFNCALSSTEPDPTPPTVGSVNPPPGIVPTLTQITVVFSEPVEGVGASDLLINGTPASTMTGGNDTYTFDFPQPPFGNVNVTWQASHGIADFAIPPNPFNASGPGATWQYVIRDAVPPTVLYQLPFAGVTVQTLNQIEVNFSEAVAGVDASDLLINDHAAEGLTAITPAQYVFTFPAPPPGPVEVAWAADAEITDLAAMPNPFAGGSWTYHLDPNAELSKVRLNELMAANVNGLRDEDGEQQDWVELHNFGTNSVSLAGWSLTDDENDEAKWIFPPVAIPANGYLIVFCSGKDRKPITPGGKLHTNFKLDPDGEFLGLYNSEVPRQLISSFSPYPNQRRDYSYGYDPNNQLRYFQVPSPGTANGSSTISGVVADTKFSHDRGFFDAPFTLSITSATPGVTIRYTLDGTAPTVNTGLLYTNSLVVTGTTVIRAAAFKTGLLPSDVDAQTYLFLDDVITQSPTGTAPPGWPASWGANTVDYGMDPEIITNPLYRDTIKDDLKSIPSFCIVMNLADLFSASTGIYANPGQDGIQWERPCSLELIYPDGGQGFQVNCGIRLRGGFSRSTANPKHAFRIFFRQEYGASKLNYRMFGPTGADSFDKFDLRTLQNYSWSFQGDANMICLRDQMSRDIQLAMGEHGARGDWYHLYINGVYWGLYNTEERPEASFGESYFGGREEDYDVIKVEAGPYTINATDGNMEAWTRLWQAATNGFDSDVAYFKVQGLNPDGTPNPGYENLLDVVNLIDYMLVILYGGNLDAPISNFLGNDGPNNWYGLRDRTGQNGGFRFVSHDAEHTLLSVGSDRTGIVDLSQSGGQFGVINGDWTAGNPITQGEATALSKSNPQYIWFRLQQNAEFRLLVADRAQKHCFNDGALSVNTVRTMYLARSNEIQRAIVGESARWGDAKVATPYTRQTWLSALQNVYNNFLGGRTAVLINQLRADGLFPNLNAPLLSSYGGVVSNGFTLYLTNDNGAGAIYYTLDGSDPRVRGGNISSTALAYAPGMPILINFPATVRARVRSGAIWSALAEATFYPAQNFDKLIFTEIMYNPPGVGATPGDEFEFLELKNTGTNVLDLSGMNFTDGISCSFTNGTRLNPGQFLVLGRNRTTLQARYPGLAVHSTYTGRLDNGGETITLSHPLGTKVISVEYKDSGRWPLTPDGMGYSLVAKNPNANPNPNNPTGWRASTNPLGSPGADDPPPATPGVLVNEALTHTDPPLVDSVELYNPTAVEVDIGGWFLTDDGKVPQKFRLPDGTTIPAEGYRVFTEADFNPTSGVSNHFNLDSHGEEVYLFSADANTNLTGYSHGFTFGAAENGVSFGRHVISTGDEHFVPQISRTPGSPNSGARVGPIVIRQIMYHPPDRPGGLDNQADEFIEIRNITEAMVPLHDPANPTNFWRVRGGVDFDFPPGLILSPTQSLVLVSFSPADLTALSVFRATYGGFSGVPIYGPYAGKLDNSSDNIEIQKPDTPDTNGVPYIIVDKVDYRDSAPWPSSADGGGALLRRLDLAAYGDDPANWIGYAPLTITAQPTNLTLRPGFTAAFDVTAYGAGTLAYQWRKDGVDLPHATNTPLVLTNVQLADDGAYTVVVSDATGSLVSAPATLGILITPSIVQPPVGQTVVAGGQVTLSCTITGNPPPFTYQWRIGSTPIHTNVSDAPMDFYTFTAPSIAVTQSYRVVVKNAASPSGGVSHPTLAAVIVLGDTDHDGIPDDWESGYGLSPTNNSDANIDSDGDTMSNRAEYIAGTDPTDSTSYLKFEQMTGIGGSGRVSFVAQANRTYTVQYKDELAGEWVTLADVVARSTNHLETVVDPGPLTNRFYRLVTPQTK